MASKKIRATPKNLEEALKAGWQIHEQLSSWRFRSSNKREGFLMLSRKGESRTLYVPFVALYDLQKPFFLN